MTNSENDDFEKDPNKNGAPIPDSEDDFFTKSEDEDFFTKEDESDSFVKKGGNSEDPFASLLDSGASEETESTMARLSHLEEDKNLGKKGDDEDTEVKLSHLLTNTQAPSGANGETTEQKLSNLLADVDFLNDGPKEETEVRLGKLEQKMEETEASDEEDDLPSESASDVSALLDGLPNFDEDTASESSYAKELSDDLGGGAFNNDPFADDFGQSDAELNESDSSETETGKGKKKKGKKVPKTPKTKVPKAKKSPKTHSTRKKEKLPRTGADVLIVLSLIFFLAVIALGNFVGVMAPGVNLPFFLVLFNGLGLILLMIPSLLKAKKRREKSLNFYDALLAMALAFLIFGCMALVMVQSKYGTSVKVTAQTNRFITQAERFIRL